MRTLVRALAALALSVAAHAALAQEQQQTPAQDLKKLEPLGLDKFRENKLTVADKAQAEALLKKYVP